jgi:hypothetical protein
MQELAEEIGRARNADGEGCADRAEAVAPTKRLDKESPHPYTPLMAVITVEKP